MLHIRKNEHLRKSKNKKFSSPFLNAIRKYSELLTWEVLESELTHLQAIEKERFYISFFNTQNSEKGYNVTEGGDGGQISPLAMKRRLEKMKLYYEKPKNLKKMSEIMKRVHQEHPEKFKEFKNMSKRWKDPEFRKKITKSLYLSANKIENRIMKQKHSKGRPFVCLDNGMIFRFLRDSKEFLQCETTSAVHKVLKKSRRKYRYLRFRYLTDEEINLVQPDQLYLFEVSDSKKDEVLKKIEKSVKRGLAQKTNPKYIKSSEKQSKYKILCIENNIIFSSMRSACSSAGANWPRFSQTLKKNKLAFSGGYTYKII